MIRTRWLLLPKLIRFLLIHFANGVVIGCSTALLLIWNDIAGMGIFAQGDKAGLASLLLFAEASLIFGTLAASVAIMTMDYDHDC